MVAPVAPQALDCLVRQLIQPPRFVLASQEPPPLHGLEDSPLPLDALLLSYTFKNRDSLSIGHKMLSSKNIFAPSSDSLWAGLPAAGPFELDASACELNDRVGVGTVQSFKETVHVFQGTVHVSTLERCQSIREPTR